MTRNKLVLAPLFQFLLNAGWPTELIPIRLHRADEFDIWLAQRSAGKPFSLSECVELSLWNEVAFGILIGQHYYHLLHSHDDPTPHLHGTSEYEIGEPFLRYLKQAGWLY